MEIKKYELHHMTWKEIDEAFKEDPVIFIPMASMEQHGPTTLVGDFIAAQEIANEAAKKSNSYSVPVIPFGYSEVFRNFPGCISLRPKTFYNIIYDVCMSLIEHNITKIILVNGHGGNAAILDMLARDIKREHKIMIGVINLWQSLPEGFLKELYGENINLLGHGADPSLSIFKYLTPQYLRMDLMSQPKKTTNWEAFKVKNSSKVEVCDASLNLSFDFDEITDNGVTGDPSIATAEIGEKIVNKCIDYCVEFASKMKKSKMLIK